ncbi:hypothetical protein [Chitinophaga pinensis]|nr:hypothetical protein [Chitinophaga pinensis]
MILFLPDSNIRLLLPVQIKYGRKEAIKTSIIQPRSHFSNI